MPPFYFEVTYILGPDVPYCPTCWPCLFLLLPQSCGISWPSVRSAPYLNNVKSRLKQAFSSWPLNLFKIIICIIVCFIFWGFHSYAVQHFGQLTCFWMCFINNIALTFIQFLLKNACIIWIIAQYSLDVKFIPWSVMTSPGMPTFEDNEIDNQAGFYLFKGNLWGTLLNNHKPLECTFDLMSCACLCQWWPCWSMGTISWHMGHDQHNWIVASVMVGPI